MEKNEKIIQKDVLTSYKEDMVTYSIGVNRRRAIPEQRDGLKPVQRRILFTMYELGAINEATQLKGSNIVGTTMARYHSHGDSSIYGSFFPIANYWSAKMPLIEVHGNAGTFMGDGPAASRYTEERLSKFAYETLFAPLDESRNVVDWSKNYDEKRMEPDFLPAKVPILLINGASGIGVGMACDIPKHNFHEVIEVTRKVLHAYLDALIRSKKSGKEEPVEDVEVVLIPDHCLPSKIIDTDWKTICRTGNGSYKSRCIVDIEEYEGYPAVIVKSLCDGVTTNSITEKMNEMVMNKELPMVKDIIDVSGAGEVRIIVQLKKGSDPYFVREVMYKRTDCEKSNTVNFEIVDGINVGRMNYKQYIERFIQSSITTKFRMYCNKMQKIMTRWHKLDAYIKAIESGEIDYIIDLIRKQKTIDDTAIMETLIKKLNITDLQARFIIDANIKQLSKGYLNKYKKEANALWEKKQHCEAMIRDKELILREIDEELEYFDKKYSKPRMSKIIKAKDESNIPQGTFKLIITENNYVRKILDTENPTAVRGDSPKFILRVDNRESVLIFDNKGKVYKLPVHKIPVSERYGAGIDIRMVIKGLTANIIATFYDPDIKTISKMKEKHFVTVITENNYIKKLDIQDFLTVPPSGIIYTKLTDNDSVKGISIIPDMLDVIIYSGHKALRIPMSEVPNYKRASQGVFAMNTDDLISGLSVVYPDSEYILVLTRNGKVNKYNISGLERSTRYKAGSSVIKLDKSDNIFSIYGVNNNNILRVVTETGVEEIDVANVPITSSVSKGNKMINTKNNIIIKTDVIIK